MSESSDVSILLVAAIVGTVVALLLLGCCVAQRYPAQRLWSRWIPDEALSENACWSAMTSCFGCCGLCVVTAGHGAADAAANGAKVVGTAGTAAATESEPYRLFMCGWLGWLVHNVLCCCCCYHGPRTDELAAAEAGSAPVVVSTAVAAPESSSSFDGAAGAAKVGAKEAGGKGVDPLAGERQPADAAGVTTPLLALAV